MSTTLAKVVQLSKPVSPRWKAEARQLEVLSQQVADGEALLKTLLPIEALARERVSALLAPLRKQQQELQRRAAGLRRLSLEPLTWRDAQGYPLLAVFDLDHPYFVLEYNSHIATHFTVKFDFDDDDSERGEELPLALQDCFSDVEEMMHKKSVRYAQCRFTGIIPDDVKQRIDEVRDMFEDIFILAEAENWKLEAVDPDPLVVGWDGESLWLIAVFDVTPVEAAMAFTVPGASKS